MGEVARRPEEGTTQPWLSQPHIKPSLGVPSPEPPGLPEGSDPWPLARWESASPFDESDQLVPVCPGLSQA